MATVGVSRLLAMYGRGSNDGMEETYEWALRAAVASRGEGALHIEFQPEFFDDSEWNWSHRSRLGKLR